MKNRRYAICGELYIEYTRKPRRWLHKNVGMDQRNSDELQEMLPKGGSIQMVCGGRDRNDDMEGASRGQLVGTGTVDRSTAL